MAEKSYKWIYFKYYKNNTFTVNLSGTQAIKAVFRNHISGTGLNIEIYIRIQIILPIIEFYMYFISYMFHLYILYFNNIFSNTFI